MEHAFYEGNTYLAQLHYLQLQSGPSLLLLLNTFNGNIVMSSGWSTTEPPLPYVAFQEVTL